MELLRPAVSAASAPVPFRSFRCAPPSSSAEGAAAAVAPAAPRWIAVAQPATATALPTRPAPSVASSWWPEQKPWTSGVASCASSGYCGCSMNCCCFCCCCSCGCLHSCAVKPSSLRIPAGDKAPDCGLGQPAHGAAPMSHYWRFGCEGFCCGQSASLCGGSLGVATVGATASMTGGPAAEAVLPAQHAPGPPSAAPTKWKTPRRSCSKCRKSLGVATSGPKGRPAEEAVLAALHAPGPQPAAPATWKTPRRTLVCRFAPVHLPRPQLAVPAEWKSLV